MEISVRTFTRKYVISSNVIAAAVLVLFSPALAAQEPARSSTDVQRESMRKLSFLEGKWSGPITVVRGPGEPLHLTQTEDVQYKLDGLVMLVEGKSTGLDGKIMFNALATISYDDASHTYWFRAYNDGHYLDTELSVVDKGFSWQFQSGPAHVVNTMQLTKKGEWSEVTEVTVGNNPPNRSVDMLLQHQP
ncbi:MAG: hypothetical protein ABSF28_15850 [Terracidiphilus sp.]|jgi:hypothetical protein